MRLHIRRDYQPLGRVDYLFPVAGDLPRNRREPPVPDEELPQSLFTPEPGILYKHNTLPDTILPAARSAGYRLMVTNYDILEIISPLARAPSPRPGRRTRNMAKNS
jgi:hypothetical protein